MSDNKAIETLYEDLMGGPVFYAALFDGKLYIIEASDFMEAETKLLLDIKERFQLDEEEANVLMQSFNIQRLHFRAGIAFEDLDI